MNKLVIIGGHGNGTVISSTVEDINTVKPTWEIIGFINDGDCVDINGYRVLGCIEQKVIDELLCDPEIYFYWSLISVKFNHKFIHNLERLNIPLSQKVLREDLVRYGRDTISISIIEEGVYYLDFSI